MRPEHRPAALGTRAVPVLSRVEHDSCPRCGSVEIGTAFSRFDSPEPAVWDCHCSECRFRWSVGP
jgi:hypothetical protein